MKLVILQGEQRMDTELDEAPMTIGRSSDADIQISDPGISRKHLQVHVSDQTLRIKDLGSRNAFKVRGTRVREAVLQHNEEFAIGTISFVFQMHDDELPGATLPQDDQTPIDAEFVSTDTDHVNIPAEKVKKAVPAVKAVPVRGIVPSSDGTLSKPNLFKNKKMMVMAAIPLAVIAIALLAKVAGGGNRPIGPTQPTGPSPQQPQANARDKYINSCVSAVEIFEEYFDKPSRYASKLDNAISTLKEALGIQKLQRLKTAPALDALFVAFKETDHNLENFDDIGLHQIITSCQDIEDAREANHTLKSFASKMMRWSENQLGAFGDLNPLKKASNSTDVSKLIETYQKVKGLETDHIYASSQSELEARLFKKIGETYMKQAQEALRQTDESLARELLSKASNYGKKKEASDILSSLDSKAEEQETLEKAKESFREDRLDLAQSFATRIKVSSPFYEEAQIILKDVNRRRLLIAMRQEFTAGKENNLNALIEESDLKDDDSIQNLYAQMRTTINHYKNALKALKEEDYEKAKLTLEDTYNSVHRLDRNNFYKLEAARLVQDLAPEKLAQKHYERGLSHFNQKFPNYSEARDEFDVAEKYNPIIADNEIDQLINIAKDRLQKYFIAKSDNKITSEELEETKDLLKDCLKWLRNTGPQTSEGITYKSIQSALKN